MSVLRDIIAVFKKRQKKHQQDQFFIESINQLFDFLSHKIDDDNNAHVATVFIKNFLSLSGNDKKKKLPESYLYIEKYLTDIDRQFSLSKKELRMLVKVEFASLLALKDFALIFEDEQTQEFELSRLFLLRILDGLFDLLGDKGSEKLQGIKNYLETVPNAFPSKNPLNEKSFNPSDLGDWVHFLRRLGFLIYDLLKEKLGEETALRRFDTAYEAISKKYINLDSFQIIISLLPEQLMDEGRINTLSKHQIEKLLLKKADHFEQITKDLSEKNEELEKTQKLLIEAKNKAEEATRSKAMFLANMSHEIRTPMNAVIGMTEILKDSNPTKEQLLYIDTIHKSGYDLIHIINDILDYSKIESGKLELEQKELNIHDFASDVANLLMLKAEEKNIDLIYYVDETIPPSIEADPIRLKQIMVNLIGNAIKFTNIGEVIYKITLDKLHDNKVELIFAVSDTGIGIPENKLGNIFDSFSQVDVSTTRNYGGTGLGLAITKSLIDLMGGEISVSSEIGKGSIFTFKIEIPYNSSKKLKEIPAEFKGKTVLLADQNHSQRDLLKLKLGAWGFKVNTFSSLNELVANFRKYNSIDIILIEEFVFSSEDETLQKSFQTHISSKKIPLVRIVPFGFLSDTINLQNSLLTVNKPLRRTDLINVMYKALTEANPSAEFENISETYKPKKIKILLAEDNPTNQMVAKGLLTKIGYSMDIAVNGEEVLNKIKHSFYDLILMDVQMPVLDGLKTTQKIRQTVYKDGQPIIIAMTANASEEDKQICIFAGMNDYLSKPVRKNEIIEKLEKWFPDK